MSVLTRVTFDMIKGFLSAVRVTYESAAGITRSLASRLKDTRTLEDFGAVGDNTTDDTVAVQAAMLWVAAASGRKLVSGKGTGYKITAPIMVDFSGNKGCSVNIGAPFLPVDNLGDMLTFKNTRDSVFLLSVRDGGASASNPNYGTSDPAGAQQAFVLQGLRSCSVNVRGYNYKGRVLRTKLETVGQYKTSSNSFVIFTGENNTPCGQALYAEGSSNWGTIQEWYSNWDLYGPVLYEVEDVTIVHLEGGWATNNGMVLAGVGSLHGVVVAIGNENPGSTIKSLHIKQSSSGKQCRRISILDLLIAGAYDGLWIEADGMASEDIASYFKITTSNSRRYGVYANNARDTTFIHGATGDYIPLRYSGNSYGCKYQINSAKSRLQAIQIDATTLNGVFSGHILSAGYELTGAPCIACDSVANLRFDNMHVQTLVSLNNAGAYKLVAGNKVRVTGGTIEKDSGTTPSFAGNVLPLRVMDVVGFVNKGSGASFIPAGALFVDVAHGMNVRPSTVSCTRSAGFTQPIRVNLVSNDSTFKVTVDSAMAADAYFYWSADAIRS